MALASAPATTGQPERPLDIIRVQAYGDPPAWLDDLRRGEMPRVLFLTGGVDGCLLWRVWWTCAHLSSHGFVADYVRYENLNDMYPVVATGRYNVLVTPRFVWRTRESAEQFVAKVREDGLCWVYEGDDDLWSPEIVPRQVALFPPGHPMRDADQFEWERQERVRVVSLVDGITVSSAPLAEVVRQYTDQPVMTVPNAIDVAWFRNVLKGAERVTEPLTIGWMGGQRNDDDLEAVGEAWANLARRYPELRFAIHGYPSRALTAGVPEERLTILPWSTIEFYPRALANFDIGCCSVSRDPWNLRKTPIKWFEMSVAGVPCVVSPPLYGEVVADGENALVAETPGEWESELARLIEDETARRSIAAAALATVIERHSMQANWWRWVQTWAFMLRRFNGARHA